MRAMHPTSGMALFRIVVLIRSVDRNPRRVRIIYHVPREEAYLIGTGRICLLRTARRWRPTRDWSDSTAVSMYELL